MECKLDQRDPTKALKYLKAKFPAVRAIQVGMRDGADFKSSEGVEVMPAVSFLQELI